MSLSPWCAGDKGRAAAALPAQEGPGRDSATATCTHLLWDTEGRAWSSLNTGCRTGPSPRGLCGAKGKQEPTGEATGTCWARQCWALAPRLGGCSRALSLPCLRSLWSTAGPSGTGAPCLPLLALLGRTGRGGSWLQPLLTERCSLVSLQLCSHSLTPT